MKYLFAIVLLALSMSANATPTYEESLRAKVMCVEGYKFLVTWVESGMWQSPTVVQIFKKSKYTGNSYPAQPIECNENQ